ncbi:hypothetical protein ABZ619_38995 [Streptomyces sp. NPDC007851]|uniref:hypothetical protein n=1 Tax=Streptomyces sp. NPDC007851 TaxID=3155008 RepID=UPI0033F1C57C
MSTDTNPTTEQDSFEEEQPARYLVHLSPLEENPARFHQREKALEYARGYGLGEHAIEDSWATGDTLPPWLAQAEAEVDAERAESDRMDEELAVEFASIINRRLAQLGITPITPAGSDGQGHFAPAFLAASDEEERRYAVYAGFDEEEGAVTLLVEDYRRQGQREFHGLKLAVEKLVDVRNVLYARRNGPLPTPKPKPQPSRDAQAIVGALDQLTAAVDSLARIVSRP